MRSFSVLCRSGGPLAVAMVVMLGGPGSSSAQTKKPPAKAAATPVSKDLTQRLRSLEEGKVMGALDEMRLAGPAADEFAKDVVVLLAGGVSAKVAEAALDTLADVSDKPVVPGVAPYLNHRAAKVRRAAVRALGRAPSAMPLFRRALSDPDAGVRAMAATALGGGGAAAREALPDLFRALDQKLPEAASAIGAVCAPADCDAFLARLGKEPFDVMGAGFEAMLLRPDDDLTDEVKVRVVQSVAGLATPEANAFLRGMKAKLKSSAPSRTQRAIDQGIHDTGGERP